MTTEEDKFKAIATKISPKAYKSLKRLARKQGITIYEILQMCVDTLIRYMSDQYNLTAEMEHAMSIFEHMTEWRDSANFADPSAEWEVSEATFYLTAKGKKGTRAVHVSKAFMGTKVEDVNIQRILEKALNYLVPERYIRLRSIANYVGAHNILELLDRMVDGYDLVEVENQSIRAGFEDADRAENNKPVRYGERTRRKKRGDLYADDKREAQQTIHFAPEDMPDMPELKDRKEEG